MRDGDRRPGLPALTGELDVMRLGEVFARCGYFKDATDPAKAIVKILYGRELGVGPVTAMMSINIIEGKPAPSANLLAAMVKRSSRYDYRVNRSDTQRAEVEFYQDGESVGVSVFSMEAAAAAGLADKQNWRRYPQAMLFSRAVSAGCRMYCPDLFGGAPVYSPEELGAEVNEDGAIISLPTVGPVDTSTGEVLPPRVDTRPDTEWVAVKRNCAKLWRDLGNGDDPGEFMAALIAVSGESWDNLKEFSVEALESFRDHLRGELAEVAGEKGEEAA